MGELSERRDNSESRLGQVRSMLSTKVGKIMEGKACVYATGSYGRAEASKHSDLDLFILGETEQEVRALKNLDEILVKAGIIEVTRELEFPEFSGDGRYFTHYTVKEMTEILGKPEDDSENTFTARLLLLLESKYLVESTVYERGIDKVIDAYWKDYDDHEADFMPAFLANDILRLWRTFCVNYEARTKQIPEREKIRRKIKNYKLKHSRLLTCYSALIYMLAVYKRDGTVSRDDIRDMTRKTPTERLEWLKSENSFSVSCGSVDSLLSQYEKFLKTTNKNEEDLIAEFSDSERASKHMQEANTFGTLAFDTLNCIGRENPFYRLLVV